MMSPELTVSPTFINQLESVPSSIVGERAGILSSIAMMYAGLLVAIKFC
jgi:hypothetical protein